ncbi:MAG: hypothetical protein QGG40_12865, partial [Myxococcota bacterium]|nr:hypothetical protein [Myxococcota bacterium]
ARAARAEDEEPTAEVEGGSDSPSSKKGKDAKKKPMSAMKRRIVEEQQLTSRQLGHQFGEYISQKAHGTLPGEILTPLFGV